MSQSNTKTAIDPTIRCLACLLPFGNGHVCQHCGISPGNVPWEYPQLRPGSMLHGRYLIGRVLGKGGFAITYLALQEGLNRRVAIKEYFPSGVADRGSGSMTVCLCKNVSEDSETTEFYRRGVKRFLEEGRNIVECHQPNPHPNLVRVSDYFEDNGTAYLVMDYVEGVSLEVFLKMQPRNRLDEREARKLILPVLSGLSAVHKRGFLHRDVKPSNIYISKDGTVTLIDFGSTRQVLSGERHTLTVTLTQGYAPPEQYSGDGKQGPWTDVYGAAATLYRCVTGEKPPSALSRMSNPVIVAPSSFPDVRISGRMEKTIMAGLHMDHTTRIQSTEEFQQRLGGLRTEMLYETVAVSGLLRSPRQLVRMAFTLVAVFVTVALTTTCARLIWNHLGDSGAPQHRTGEDRQVSKQTEELYRAGTMLLDKMAFRVGGNEIKDAAMNAGQTAMNARSALDTSWVARQSSDAYKAAIFLYTDGERALGEGKYSDAHAAYDSAAESFAGIILTDNTASSGPRAALAAIREKVGRQHADLESGKVQSPSPAETMLGENLLNQAIAEPDPQKAVGLYRQASVVYGKLLPAESDDVLARARAKQHKKTEEAEKAKEPSMVDPSIPVQEVDMGEGVTFQMVQIPAGEFVMGSPAGEYTRQEDEGPQHRVRITKGFWMGRFEVTVAQFARFVRQTGYRTAAEYAGGAWDITDALKQEWEKGVNWRKTGYNPSPNAPVVLVSWDDTQAYCRWLSEGTHRGFRLPTEAEWEYACRAGSTTAFQWGNEVEGGEGWLNGADAKLRAKHPQWRTFPFSDGSLCAAKAGSYRGNAWGLHDMHGNVWEWCQDWYGPQYYSASAEADPFNGQMDRFHAVRGGSWLCYPGFCRSAVRRKHAPEYTTCDVGFRVVMSEEKPPAPVGLQMAYDTGK